MKGFNIVGVYLYVFTSIYNGQLIDDCLLNNNARSSIRVVYRHHTGVYVQAYVRVPRKHKQIAQAKRRTYLLLVVKNDRKYRLLRISDVNNVLEEKITDER